MAFQQHQLNKAGKLVTLFLVKGRPHGSEKNVGLAWVAGGFLDCYWVGSLDFNFFVEIKLGFPLNPPKSGETKTLFAGGRCSNPGFYAPKRPLAELALRIATPAAAVGRALMELGRSVADGADGEGRQMSVNNTCLGSLVNSPVVHSSPPLLWDFPLKKMPSCLGANVNPGLSRTPGLFLLGGVQFLLVGVQTTFGGNTPLMMGQVY